MRILTLAIPIAALSSGCIVYDNDQGDGSIREHTARFNGGFREFGRRPSMGFLLRPHKPNKENLHLALSFFDRSTCLRRNVPLFGDVSWPSMRSNEVLLSVGVAADAEAEADIVVESKTAAQHGLNSLVISPRRRRAANDYPTEEAPEDDCLIKLEART